ncbi:MAG: anaerobic ribonucleoside-triphosphate reductase activating protein [Alistipes sp.]
MSSTNSDIIRVLDIVYGTSVDGVGLRTSVYCAGCEHRCEGCHNRQSWALDGGRDMTVEDLFAHIEDAGLNVTFSGGDPMLRPEGFTTLARMIKARTSKTIWCYTGYLYEDVLRHPLRRALLETIDVLVDGRFVQAERDLSLLFRGSRNQRIIDVPHSLAEGRVVLFQPETCDVEARIGRE